MADNTKIPLTEEEINDIDEWMPGIANRLIGQAREANRLRRVVQMIIDKEQNGEPSWSRRILEESAYAALKTEMGK